MKALKITCTLIILLAWTQISTAQLTGGGERETQPAERQVTQESLFDNGVLLRVGWSSPKGQFGQVAGEGDSYDEIFSSEAGFGAQRGLSTGMDIMAPIGQQHNNLFNMGFDAQLGYKIGFAYTRNDIDWSDIGGSWEEDTEYEPFQFLDLKAGAVLALRPVNNLVVDLFYNPMLSIHFPGRIDRSFDTVTTVDGFTVNYSYNELIEVPEGDDEFPMGIRHGIGFNIRYGSFTLSVETMFGAIDYNYERHVSVITDGFGNSFDVYNYDTEMSNNVTTLTFGFAL